METQPAGAPPQAAPAASVTPPAAPAASSLPKQDNLIERLNTISTPAQARAMRQEMMSRPPAPPPVAPPPPAPDAGTPPAAEPAAPAPEAAEPESTPDTPAETSEPVEPAPSEGETPETPSAPKQFRIRVPEKDEVGRLTLSFSRRNPDWTLEQAMDAARNELGIKPPTTAAAPTTPAPKSDLPATPEAVDQAVEKLLVDRAKALEAMDYENFSKLDLQVRKLDSHRLTLERQAEQARASEEIAYNQKFESSETQASQLYAFASDPNSEGAKRMREIEQDLKDTGSPLYDSPDKPLKIAHMVAVELNIAPRSKKAATAKPAVAPAAPAPKKQVLPGGSTVPAAPSKPALDKEVESANTPYAIRNLVNKYTKPTATR